MTVGYPDYERLQLQSGQLLGNINQKVGTTEVTIAAVYVGSLPFINVYWDGGGSNGFYQIIVGYYTDETFSTQISAQDVIRAGFEVGITQFPTLSAFAAVAVVSQSAGNDVNVKVSAYGTTQRSTNFELNALDGNLIYPQSVTATPGTYTRLNCPHTFTGRLQTVVHFDSDTNVNFIYEYWELSVLAWVEVYVGRVVSAGEYTIREFAAPDAPKRFSIQNYGGTGNTTDIISVCALPSG